MTAPYRRKKKTGFWLMIGGGVLLLLILIVVVVGDKGGTPGVLVETAQRRTILASVSESGTLEPVLEVKIAPDVSGEVVQMDYKEGDLVKKGEMLVTIRPDNYRTAVEQATASLNQAEANLLNSKASISQAWANFLQDSVNLQRTKELFEKKVVSQLDYENAQLKRAISQAQYEAAKQANKAAFYSVENAKAMLRQAQQNLERTTILASMSGTITRISKRVGERAVGTGTMEGTEILRIADLSRMRVSVEINENDIVHIKIGDTATVKVDAYEGKKFKGRVTEIAYSASDDLSSLTSSSSDQVTNFIVKVEIDSASYKKDPEIMRGLLAHQSPFRPSMSAQVEIFTEQVQNVVTVPTQAVTVERTKKATPGEEDNNKLKTVAPADATKNDEPREIVFVLDGTRVRAQEVKTGLSDSKFIEIKEGLKGGETIVTGPYIVLTQQLKDGSTVKIIKESDRRKANGD